MPFFSSQDFQSISLNLSNNSSEEDFRLLELPLELISEIEKNDSSVCIKGKPNDEAILCTSTKSYVLKLVETSNTVLLLPDPILPREQTPLTKQKSIQDEILSPNEEPSKMDVKSSQKMGETTSCFFVKKGYFEVIETKGQVQTLKQILPSFRGESISKITSEGFTFSELCAQIQASPFEIKQALSDFGAIEVHGFWFQLNLDYRDLVISFLYDTIFGEDWNPQAISENEAVQALSEGKFDSCTTKYCLKLLSQSWIPTEKDVIYTLDLKKLCVFKAIDLLRKEKSWMLDAFLEKWKTNTPEGIEINVDMLRGTAVVYTEERVSFIKYLAVSELPQDPKERISKLFQIKKLWSFVEIEPYLRDITSSNTSIEQLLLRYSRIDSNGFYYPKTK